MNRKKILGIIFVIAALVCLHGFSTAMSREDGHTTKTMEQIEKAVFLQNGKVDKDNEGKPVIVRGKLHTAKSAHDTQLDLTFESAYVERRMETLGDNGKWTEDRAPADSSGAGDPVCENFIGKLEKKIKTIRRIHSFDSYCSRIRAQ